MPKKEYIQAKKDIESLVESAVENLSSGWEEAFRTERIYEGENIVGFKYTDNALEIQKALKHGIDSAIVIAQSINTPDFFDYLLGEVKIEGDYQTYTEPHVTSDKKYFNFSQSNKKTYFTDKLLLGLVNIAPKGSQAFKVRNECKELMVLSFVGIPEDHNVQACVMDCNHINKFINLEKLKIYNPKSLTNSSELKKLTGLNDLSIEGSTYELRVGYDSNYFDELFIDEDLPVLENLKSLHIEKATNKDLSVLKKIKGIQNISIRHCTYLESLTGLDVSEVLDLDIFECNQLIDTSILNDAVKVKNVMLSSEGSDMESYKSLNISFVEHCSLVESLDITGCDFSNLKDVSALQNLRSLSISNPKNLTDFPLLGENKNLNNLRINAPNLTDLKGIGQCINLKTISLSNNKNLNTIEQLKNIKFIDIKLNWSGIKNLDFLENIQIISNYNHSLGYNEEFDISEGAFSVSYDRSDEDKKKSGNGLPDGIDANGHVIPEFYEDGYSSDFIRYNRFELNDCPNLEQIQGLKNVTNIMALDLRNCVNLTSLDGVEKMLDLREIDLTDCTNLESIHALKNCSKLEEILAFGCNKLSPKPKVKNMDTLEKVQEYLKELM